MSFADGEVLLCRLYERTSAKGHRYLAGRLGNAKLVAFLDTQAKLQFGATACFTVFLQSNEERKPGGQMKRVDLVTTHIIIVRLHVPAA